MDITSLIIFSAVGALAGWLAGNILKRKPEPISAIKKSSNCPSCEEWQKTGA